MWHVPTFPNPRPPPPPPRRQRPTHPQALADHLTDLSRNFLLYPIGQMYTAAGARRTLRQKLRGTQPAPTLPGLPGAHQPPKDAMRLVIAEKPSMAKAIAEALGITGRGRSYLQGEVDGQKVLVTWCVGHLVETAEPEVYGAKQWSFSNLPILPDKFQFRVIAQTQDQYQVVCGLLQRPDVLEVVNATDAGREGQLIFHLTYDLAGCEKPVKRLWTSSLTEEAIRQAWKNLKDEADFRGLTEAARCRQEADWLVGINCTRAQTLVAQALGKQGVHSIGRVQTPTLAMIVNRELERRHFVPKEFWTLIAQFRTEDGRSYRGKWFKPGQEPAEPQKSLSKAPADPDAAKPGAKGAAKQEPAQAGPKAEEPYERFDTPAAAEAMRQRLIGQPAKVTKVEAKQERRKPELLYDLTALQRESNKRFGYTAEQTLEIAQALYEAKLLSYPRTSSRHLTDDDAAKAPVWLGVLDRGPYAAFVQQIRAMGKSGEPPKLSGRFVDAKQVEDHHALVVTDKVPKYRDGELDLPQDQARIYDLVARRLLAAWFPDRIEQKTTVLTAVTPQDGGAAELFRTTGTVLKDPGFSAVDAAPRRPPRGEEEADAELPPLKRAEAVTTQGIDVKTGKTTPPKAMTEADLLAAMQGAGRELDDDALKGALKDRGLGTPATRANIIETLIKRAYIGRERNNLVATEKGIELIQTIQVAELKSPEMTGQWEAVMEQIRRGQAERPVFMQQIRDFVRSQVEALRGAGVRSRVASQTEARQTAQRQTGPVGQPPLRVQDCPACGSPLVERVFQGVTSWRCSGLQRPDCRAGWSLDAAGEPSEGRCQWCHSPRRRDRAGKLQCLHCGRTEPADADLPPLPPLVACSRCRQLARLIWSVKKNAWLMRCDRCDLWMDPVDPSKIPPEPPPQPCTACSKGTAMTWSVQQRRWLWRCTSCRQWAFVAEDQPVAGGALRKSEGE